MCLISRQLASLAAPMGRAVRATPGRACEPCRVRIDPALSPSGLHLPLPVGSARIESGLARKWAGGWPISFLKTRLKADSEA